MIPWKVTKLEALPGHRLQVTFADGLSGIVDLSKDKFDGILAPLADETYFAQARLEDGVVTWRNGAEIAPDACTTKSAPGSTPLPEIRCDPTDPLSKPKHPAPNPCIVRAKVSAAPYPVSAAASSRFFPSSPNSQRSFSA